MSKLTREQHAELARLLNQAADNLNAATRIVSRAPFTDRSLYVAGVLQEWLIDPLIEDWRDQWSGQFPYQSVGYHSPRRVKSPPTGHCLPRGRA